MPICLRDDNVFDQIGELFYKVGWPSGFAWTNKDIAEGKTYVLLSPSKKIEEVVFIVWKGQSHEVWVYEEMAAWVAIRGGRDRG